MSLIFFGNIRNQNVIIRRGGLTMYLFVNEHFYNFMSIQGSHEKL